jgi:hypothetical protein
MNRALAALFAAALAFPVLILALGLHRMLGGALSVGALLFASVLVLGFPTLILFCKRQWWELWRFVLGGTMGGALCALPFAGNDSFKFVFLVLTFALIGTLASIPFWFAAVWRNEALTCPKEFCLPCGVVYRFARGVLCRPIRD